MKEFWNQRYSEETYAYGEEPNGFLEQELKKLSPQSILFPAEGEGRNAVYAASLGWKVTAFDISDAGKQKAQQLADRRGVTIDYHVGTLEEIGIHEQQFDAIALIYAHFPANVKSSIHRALNQLLRPGGTLIFEAFSKNNLEYVAKNPNVGGPRDEATLCSLDELKADFESYEVSIFEEKEVHLEEGLYHNGTGMVIRFVGTKK